MRFFNITHRKNCLRYQKDLTITRSKKLLKEWMKCILDCSITDMPKVTQAIIKTNIVFVYLGYRGIRLTASAAGFIFAYFINKTFYH